jgi:hypothetical protein
MDRGAWVNNKKFHATPSGYTDILAYCPICKDSIFNVPVKLSVLNRSCTIDCQDDICWDGCLYNELRVEEVEKEKVLLHNRCGNKVKLFRLN